VLAFVRCVSVGEQAQLDAEGCAEPRCAA